MGYGRLGDDGVFGWNLLSILCAFWIKVFWAEVGFGG